VEIKEEEFSLHKKGGGEQSYILKQTWCLSICLCVRHRHPPTGPTNGLQQ
jgi:hypothetical protein